MALTLVKCTGERKWWEWTHTWGWPWRCQVTGVDRQTCTECGRERVASVQFGGKVETETGTRIAAATPPSARALPILLPSPVEDANAPEDRHKRKVAILKAAAPGLCNMDTDDLTALTDVLEG